MFPFILKSVGSGHIKNSKAAKHAPGDDYVVRIVTVVGGHTETSLPSHSSKKILYLKVSGTKNA